MKLLFENLKKIISILFLILISTNTLFSQKCSPWKKEMRDEARLLTQKVAYTWLATEAELQKTKWTWVEGVLTYGLALASYSSPNEVGNKYVNFVRENTLYNQKNNAIIEWIDDLTSAIAPIDLLVKNREQNKDLLPILERTVGYIMSAPKTHNGMIKHFGRAKKQNIANALFPFIWPDAWIDSAFHFSLTLSRYSEYTGDAKYIKEAVNQIFKF